MHDSIVTTFERALFLNCNDAVLGPVKGLSIKDVRSQGGWGFVQCRNFLDKGGSSNAAVRTFRCKKFEIYDVYARTSADIFRERGGGQLFAILCGRLLWAASSSLLAIVKYCKYLLFRRWSYQMSGPLGKFSHYMVVVLTGLFRGIGRGGTPRRPSSWATPQGLYQRSKMEVAVPKMALLLPSPLLLPRVQKSKLSYLGRLSTWYVHNRSSSSVPIYLGRLPKEKNFRPSCFGHH